MILKLGGARYAVR